MALGLTLLTLMLGNGLNRAFLLAVLIDGLLLIWKFQKRDSN